MKGLYLFFSIFFCIVLFMSVLHWGDYLIRNGYLGYHNCKEGFDSSTQLNQDIGSPTTSHNVDQPLTNTTSCQNMCGSTGRCYLSGQQCSADIDCPGCNPNNPNQKPASSKNVRGNNDAGKLTGGVTPTYSSLTTDFGTMAKFFSVSGSDIHGKPTGPNHGIDTWRTKWNVGNKKFKNRYQQYGLTNQQVYQDRYLMSGEFRQSGPLASNSTIHK